MCTYAVEFDAQMGHDVQPRIVRQRRARTACLKVWEKILGHEINPSAALRSCALRYCDNGESTPLAEDTRLGIFGRLLGLADWRRTSGPAS